MFALLLSSVGVMAASLHNANLMASPNVCRNDNARFFRSAHNVAMQNHLKAWREHAGLSQDELAERVGTTKSVISLLENGHRALSDKWLRKFAEALDTTPGHILDLDPREIDNDILEIWVKLSKADRAQAASILRTFLKDGTRS